MDTFEAAEIFLAPYLPRASDQVRPHVTLTFAQSLDGCIGAESSDGRGPIALSGPESMIMTHVLRNHHDAILVGVGTVVADNPSLTVRHLPPARRDGSAVAVRQPRPVVVDSTLLRFPVDCKLMEHPSGPPVLVAGERHDESRRRDLEAAGCRVIVVPSEAEGSRRVDLRAAMAMLALAEELRSVMIEGGASVIAALLDELAVGRGPALVDSLVVTIAPRLVGRHGVRPQFSAHGAPGGDGLHDVAWQVFGNDVVLAGRPASTIRR
ncbi:dihydrofolate reductase-like domain-containing protein [Hyaloraphidium curvatum]|nr:dihydrofolate reductase-like domain-containing protein [Hyaloraphidium curvatum]